MRVLSIARTTGSTAAFLSSSIVMTLTLRDIRQGNCRSKLPALRWGRVVVQTLHLDALPSSGRHFVVTGSARRVGLIRHAGGLSGRSMCDWYNTIVVSP